MKLRIWHTANFPNKAFYHEVSSIEEAKAVLNSIADFDLGVGDGEEKPLATLRDRYNLIQASVKKYNEFSSLRRILKKYENYLAGQNAGITVCTCNAQGLEYFNEEEGDWEEWYDENDLDIHGGF